MLLLLPREESLTRMDTRACLTLVRVANPFIQSHVNPWILPLGELAASNLAVLIAGERVNPLEGRKLTLTLLGLQSPFGDNWGQTTYN